jgi:cytoskeletal protein CcmA (bactofilin family)
MFGKNGPEKAAEKAASFIDANTRVIGSIVAEGTLVLGGHVEGNITTTELQILDTGSAKGHIEVFSAIIDGMIDGKLEANVANVGATATLRGEILCKNISIEKGVDVDALFMRVT